MSLPILTVDQMRAWEAASWEAGAREEEVIAAVGREVAARVLERTRPGDRVLLLGGRGHNGDDVRAAAPHLADREVLELRVEDPGTALPALEALLDRRPAWVVDGLFGIGLNRPLSDAWVALVECLNRRQVPVLAMDVPSGLDADTGRTWGAAVRATETLTVGAPKTGLLAPGAAAWTGRVTVTGPVGLRPVGDMVWDPVPECGWTEPADFEGWPPARPVDSHKGSFGHVVIAAGSPGYHGAAVLSARGALSAGAGLVTVVTHPGTYLPVAAQLAAPMVHAWRDGWTLPPRATAIVIGPGLESLDPADPFRHQCLEWWDTAPVPVLADASALGWLPGRPPRMPGLRVVTPHPGEAARSLGCPPHAVQGNRVAALRDLSTRWGGIWVVLKGHHTLVGRVDGPVAVNGSGNPGLAQGGSGDVLAGYLGGLLARPDLSSDPARLLRFGVWRHGNAADLLALRVGSWCAEDLPGAL